MTDLSAAIAAAREAVQELDGFKHPELADAYLAHCVGTLRDLLAALDAAQPVAWHSPRTASLNFYDSFSPIKQRSDGWFPVYLAPQAPPAAVANVTPMRQPRADLARLVESINAAVYANGDGLSVAEAIGALELAKLELLKEQEQ